MKLILANNQTAQFVNFYRNLQAKSRVPFDYAPYNQLVFFFDTEQERPIEVYNCATKRTLDIYDGIYINGYLKCVEIATTVAICSDSLGINYVNKELGDAPSLSKLSGYAKLAANRVSVPKTIGGSKIAISGATKYAKRLQFPAILKRADADRGIDNFKVESYSDALEVLSPYEDSTVWILQEYIENDGYYLVSFYNSKPAFCIFRSLEARHDNDARKTHMFKPKGGSNASLIELKDAPSEVLDTSHLALLAMNRQIGSVDCLYDKKTKKTHVLEVNYNPQMVTIETFQEVRIQAFLDNLENV